MQTSVCDIASLIDEAKLLEFYIVIVEFDWTFAGEEGEPSA